MNINQDRNAAIADLLASKRWSYGVIAQMLNTTRHVVAGVAFRLRHPYATRCCLPGSGNVRNKIGHGYRPRSYNPEKTTINTR